MGKGVLYSDMKAAEVCGVAKDLAATVLGDYKKWTEIKLWVDKCCIPQTHALMPTCVGLLEEFIRRSDGMIVLLSWHYFERLWVERCESSPHDGPMHPRRNSPVRAVHTVRLRVCRIPGPPQADGHQHLCGGLHATRNGANLCRFH